MSKMNEMAMTIQSLRDAAAAITEAADFLTKAFSNEDEQQKKDTAAAIRKTEKPSLTLVDVRTLLAKKSRAGHTAEVKALLQKYGADRLSEIDPTNYEALMHDAEELADE